LQCPFKRKNRQDESDGKINGNFDKKITLWFEVEDTGSGKFSASHAIWSWSIIFFQTKADIIDIHAYQELIQANGNQYLKVLNRLIHQQHECKQINQIYYCCSVLYCKLNGCHTFSTFDHVNMTALRRVTICRHGGTGLGLCIVRNLVSHSTSSI